MKPKMNVNQPEKDLCWTPPYATVALCQFLAKESGTDIFDGSVWEPACGDHDMTVVMENWFSSVRYSDLSEGQDFLKEAPHPEHYDCIITNPPYTSKTKYAFIERCVELGKPFALLMPTETVSAARAQEAFNKSGGISLLHFDTRVDFKQVGKTWHESQAQFPTAWFIHGFGLEPGRNYFYTIKEAKKAFRTEMKQRGL